MDQASKKQKINLNSISSNINNISGDNQEGDLSQITKYLHKYQQIQVTLKMYLEICKKALKLSHESLYKQLNKYEDKVNQNYSTKKLIGNQRLIVGFLLKPNINYQISERIDVRKLDEMAEAGKKITASISQAWEEYLQLIKGNKLNKRENEAKTTKQISLYRTNSLCLAKNRVELFLKEIQVSKYRWENLTKEGLSKMLKQKKQTEEEQAYIKILKKMLNSQIQKIVQRRKTIVVEIEEDNLQQPYDKPDSNSINQNKVQRNKKKMINLGNYFKQKHLRNRNLADQDAFPKNEVEKKLNLIALRFCYLNRIQK